MTRGNSEDIGFRLVYRDQLVPVSPDLYKYFLGDLFSLGFGLYHLQHEWINAPVISAEKLCKCGFIIPCDQMKKGMIRMFGEKRQINS